MVLSDKGNIIGFQPKNRVAVNNWAANPIAKELYGGKNLSPGKFNAITVSVFLESCGHYMLTWDDINPSFHILSNV